MTSPDMFGLVNRFSCITRLNIHHQLKDYRKELFLTELHWEIFCCITSYSRLQFPKRGLVTCILGDLGADKGGEGYIWNEEK